MVEPSPSEPSNSSNESPCQFAGGGFLFASRVRVRVGVPRKNKYTPSQGWVGRARGRRHGCYLICFYLVTLLDFLYSQ